MKTYGTVSIAMKTYGEVWGEAGRAVRRGGDREQKAGGVSGRPFGWMASRAFTLMVSPHPLVPTLSKTSQNLVKPMKPYESGWADYTKEASYFTH